MIRFVSVSLVTLTLVSGSGVQQIRQLDAMVYNEPATNGSKDRRRTSRCLTIASGRCLIARESDDSSI